MHKLNSGRLGNLVEKLRELNPQPGDQLRIGMAQRSDIHAAAVRADVFIQSIILTQERVERDDGLKVPVYLVTFQ